MTYAGLDVLVETNTRFLYVGAIYVTLILLTMELQSIVYQGMVLRASRILHQEMFQRVLGAPITFFETNPLGNCFIFLLLFMK